MVSAAFKNRTRDEIIAAVRESIRKKQEWIKQSDEEFKRIREERRKLAVWIRLTWVTQRHPVRIENNRENVWFSRYFFVIL